MRRNFKSIFLIIVCGVVACAAISHVFKSWRTKQLQREIADIRRTLHEQGFKTELDDFKITTDAAMRARVAALTALGDEPKLNINGDVLVFQPVVSNGVASVLWKQEALSLGTKPYQWADLRAALNKEQVRLDAACDAALSGPFRSDMNPSYSTHYWNDTISSFDQVSRTLSYRVILKIHDGNLDAAWTNLLAVTRLVTAWEVEPAFAAHLIRATIANGASAVTWQALQFNHWPDDRLATLQSEWESPDYFTNFPEVMGLQRVDTDHRCQRWLLNPPEVDFPVSHIANILFKDPSSALKEAGYDYQAARYRGNKVLTDEKNLLLYYRDRELELRHAIQSPIWTQMRAQPGITNPPPFKSPWNEMAYSISFDSSLSSQLMAVAAVSEAQRRILVTAIALERYHGKHGSYPNSLASLSPEFLKTVPVDFMDGQPLRYRPTSDGHFLLYSVGLDCMDDGGKAPAPDALRFGSFEHGKFVVPKHVDIVWPVPAGP